MEKFISNGDPHKKAFWDSSAQPQTLGIEERMFDLTLMRFLITYQELASMKKVQIKMILSINFLILISSPGQLSVISANYL